MMEKNFSQAIAAKGIRPSMQRTAIYEYLCTHPTHPTVDAVYRSLSATHPTLSRTTVYSTLRLLAEHGLVQAITIEDDELRYDAETKPHIHFKWANRRRFHRRENRRIQLDVRIVRRERLQGGRDTDERVGAVRGMRRKKRVIIRKAGAQTRLSTWRNAPII